MRTLFRRDRPIPRSATAIIAVAAGLLPLLAGHLAAPEPAVAGADLQTVVDRWRDRAGVPAVVVAVRGPDRSLRISASGTELRGGGPPVGPNTRFRVASITKLFVATVVLQLVAEHRLATTDRLDRFVADFPGADGITVGQLLDHTSGVPDYSQLDGFTSRLLSDRDRRYTTGDVLALVAQRTRDFRPGTSYGYSNTNYVLLAEVIARVTGDTWAEQVRQRIFEPLRLADTYIAGVETPWRPVVAGYADTDNDGRAENVETGGPWPALETSEGPAGAVVSTAGDLATFGDALYRGRLLDPASLRAMTAERPFHPRNSSYGLGTEIHHLGYDTTVVGHGGFLPGFRSLLWYVPDRRLVIAVLTNDSAGNPADLAELLLRGWPPPAERGTEP